MAIVKMSKFRLLTFKNELDSLLQKFEEFVEIDFRSEDVELENMRSNNKDEIEDKIYKINQILKKIRKYDNEKKGIKELIKGKKDFTYIKLKEYVRQNNIDEVLEEINSIFYEKDYLARKIEILNNEINEYKEWENLDFDNNDLNRLRQVDVILGSMSHKNFEKFNEEELKLSYVEVISMNKKNINLLIISEKFENIEEKLRLYNFSKIGLKMETLPKDYILEKENNINKYKEKIKKYEKRLNELSKNISDLEIFHEYYSSILLKENAKEFFKHTKNINIVSGYIPKNKKEKFEKIIKEICKDNFYLEYIKFDENLKDIPVKLENNKIIEPFEMITSTYSLPRYNEVDPTIIVAPFFFIFFGMMVADFGYGIIISLLATLALFIIKLEKNYKLIAKFVFMLGISTSIWGLIYGSAFGREFSNPLHLFNPTLDYKPVMILSVVIGIIHIFIALIVKAYILIRDKKYLDALYDVGFWIVTLISTGYFIYAKTQGINDSSLLLSKYTMIIFMILIIATGGRDVKNIGGRIGLGVYALYGISGYLGDLISYVRLMALGLSGAYIAFAINMIARMLGNSIYVIIFVILILIIGHGFNLFLSMLGAYVHTSRLIYVEFFSKFYEGGGQAFKEFKIKEKYINIREN